MVQHELVEDDDAGTLAERVDDPAVLVRVVADVVERDVRLGRAPEAAGLGDDDVHALLERRAAAAPSSPRCPTARAAAASSTRLSSASSLSIVASQVTRSASSLARPPPRRGVAAFSAAERSGERLGARLGDEPGHAVVTTSSGPPASVVVTTGFSARNASYGTIPKSSSTGA